MWKNVILLVAKKVEFIYHRIYVPSTVDAELQGRGGSRIFRMLVKNFVAEHWGRGYF
jgi:hypothetical protein